MSANENQPEPLVTVTGLDHIGLRVRDVESSLLFYAGVLGLESERVKEWRNGEVTFPSIRLNSSDLSPIVGPVPLREIDHIRPPPWQTQPEAGN